MEVDEWNILDMYFRDHIYPFSKHHLDSYRQFIKKHIPETIKSYNPITMIKLDNNGKEAMKVEVYVGGKDGNAIFLDRPVMFDEDGKPILMTPYECRMKDTTYSTKLYADLDIEYTKEGNHYASKQFPHTLIGSIPLMLHSDQCVLHAQGSKVIRAFSECPMDPGGYFLVNGKEKVVVSQERIATNRLFVQRNKDPDIIYKGRIRCTASSGETALSPRTVEFLYINPEPKLAKKKAGGGKEEDEGEGEENGEEDSEKSSYKSHRGAIFVTLPAIKSVLPLTTVFRALGYETDKEIVEAIYGPIDNSFTCTAFCNFLRPSLTYQGKNPIYTMAEAHQNLKMRTFFKSIQQVKSILTLDLFPNIEEGGIKEKGMYLGYLINTFIRTVMGMLPESDRDSYAFKRVDISGFLLAQLFQETYSKLRKSIRVKLDRFYNFGPIQTTGKLEDLVTKENLVAIIPPAYITDIFTRSLKGMWGTITDDPEQGKVQDLSRISYIGFLSHLRRVNTPLDRSIKITSPHRLHSQQWGIMCPFETPDGASVGYLKNLALLTQITAGSNPATIYQLLDELGVVLIKDISAAYAASASNNVKIFINGTWYGITDEPFLVTQTLRLYRRNGLINQFISISWNIQEYEIRIQTEAGRPCRPLFIVENGIAAIDKLQGKIKTWFDMIFGFTISDKDKNENTYYEDKFISPFTLTQFQNMDLLDILEVLKTTQGCIEYLDIEEENTMLLAMNRKELNTFHTHLEIHPSTALSVVTQIVPFANHNQAPRVIFHGAQSKQAIGLPQTNFSKRFDTMSYLQHYPQKRIISTRGSHYNGNDRMPNGFNAIVAIATYSGFNQEDSILINKNSIDRGLFRITAYKTMTAIEKTLSPTDRLMFANPVNMRDSGIEVAGIKHANYGLLDESGIIKKESYIPRGQEAVVLGLLHVQQKTKEITKGILTERIIEDVYKDVSMVTDVHHYGKIDSVYINEQVAGVGSRICKVKFRKVRRPEVGDKHCSAHGQKGTLGQIIPQESMPFSKNGIVPDLIINPHAFPSRMTIGHIVETVFAKLCCMEGTTGDGTVFIPFDKDAMYTSLENHGYEKYGNEILYNGYSGTQMATEIFIGPIFYYRLKHMVTDKIHARDKGPKTQLTHQPTSGRSKSGGLRLGEMERDVLLSHGLAQFIKESYMEKSDKFKWAVCKYCGTIAKYAPQRNIIECERCKRQDISEIETPYCFKLLVQEMEAMGTQMRLATDIDYSDSDSDSDNASNVSYPDVQGEAEESAAESSGDDDEGGSSSASGSGSGGGDDEEGSSVSGSDSGGSDEEEGSDEVGDDSYMQQGGAIETIPVPTLNPLLADNLESESEYPLPAEDTTIKVGGDTKTIIIDYKNIINDPSPSSAFDDEEEDTDFFA